MNVSFEIGVFCMLMIISILNFQIIGLTFSIIFQLVGIKQPEKKGHNKWLFPNQHNRSQNLQNTNITKQLRKIYLILKN